MVMRYGHNNRLVSEVDVLLSYIELLISKLEDQ